MLRAEEDGDENNDSGRDLCLAEGAERRAHYWVADHDVAVVLLVWCGVVWCGVVWCGVVWCGVVWCGVVWCGVVWCGVVWCGVLNFWKFVKNVIQGIIGINKWCF